MRRSQHLDPEQQRKGVGGREDNVSVESRGKDGSVTTYNPIHPPEEQHIKGSVLGGDNIGRDARDIDPVPTTTKMSTNSTTIHASTSPFDLDQHKQKPKGADLRQEAEDHKRNDPSKKQDINNFLGRENSTDKNDDDATSNSLHSSETNIPVGIPIAENGDASKEQQNNFLERENSTTDKNDHDATSNSPASSETNIPVGIPITDNGDKGQQQSSHHAHVITISVESEYNVTTIITVNGKQNESDDEQHKPHVDEQNGIQKTKSYKQEGTEPASGWERCKDYCSKLYKKIRRACGCDAGVVGDN